MKEIIGKYANLMRIDWYLFLPAIALSLLGLMTMNSFSSENYFFVRQSMWIAISLGAFFFSSRVDWRFLRSTRIIVPLFLFIVFLLSLLFGLGEIVKGAQSWFQLGSLAFQPSDPAKIVTILILAKYFSRRHVEIRNIRHIIVSAIYAFIIFILVFLQPDFGGAVVIFGIWFGMVLVSGISKRHFIFVSILGITAVISLWLFVFADYQKARIVTFLQPLSDIHGAGYNAYQSTIAVGSGGIIGKGIGQGSQSKLLFLPEYETDFIFAAFVEEWGFIGAIILLLLCLMLLFRIVNNAGIASSNFDSFFGLGMMIFFSIHIAIHAGMNVGILPVTGITFPFMSYGGSHLLTEWFALGMLSSMRYHSQGPRF